MSQAVVVLANGEIVDPNTITPYVTEDTLIIAADGGLRHAFAAGIHVNILIGDLDSAPNELVQIARSRGTEVIQYPVHKDATDLELALTYAIKHDGDEITVLGGLGGRLDHALANILGLTSFAASNASITFVAEGYKLCLVTHHSVLNGEPNDIVSLLPLTASVDGITTAGLAYPLDDESLPHGTSRGVSNVMLFDRATVTVTSGLLLVVHVLREGP